MTGAPGAPDISASSRSTRTHPGRTLIVVTTVGVALIWLLLDQATKVLAVELLESRARVVGLGLIDLRVIRNSGGAFGIPGLPGMFVVVTVIVLGLVARAIPQTDRLLLATAYGLVCGGAMGNVADRLFRAPGFPSGAVVDFFDLGWFPVFNVADIGIVVGACAIAVLMTIVDREQRRAEQQVDDASVRPDTSTPGR